MTPTPADLDTLESLAVDAEIDGWQDPQFHPAAPEPTMAQHAREMLALQQARTELQARYRLQERCLVGVSISFAAVALLVVAAFFWWAR